MMIKDIHYYLSLPYTIEVVPDDGDGLWFAKVKELKGCMTQAESWEEIYPMIREAMELWLEVALDRGLEIPEPAAPLAVE